MDVSLICSGSQQKWKIGWEDGLAKLRYGVLRLGVPKMFFIVMGEDEAGFDADRDMKYAQSQQEILNGELEPAQAQAIVSA